MKFHLAKSSATTTIEPDLHDYEPGFGWTGYPPGHGLQDTCTPWSDRQSEYQSQHQAPPYSVNHFVYNSMPDPPPIYAASSMPPPRASFQQLPTLAISPQMPSIWPSQFDGQSAYHSSPPFTATGHLPSAPLSVPVPTGRTTGRNGSQPRRTLSDLDRKNMCLLAEKNPNLKQTDIGSRFGVERSTVSKVLRHKEKYLQQDDRSRSPVRKPKVKGADVERTLANWAKKQHKRGEGPSDKALKERYYFLANAPGSHDPNVKAINPAWIKKFRLQHNLLGSKSRKNSIADDSEGTSNPPSGAPTPNISSCSPTLSPLARSPSAMSIIKSEEERMKSESPSFDPGFSLGHKLYHSLSNTSLASAFDDRGPFSPRPASPGSFLSQDPTSPFSQDRVAPLGPGSISRPRSQTFPMLDSEALYMSPPSSDPMTPKYMTSTALDQTPLGDMSSALSRVEELHEPSPEMTSSPQGLALGGMNHGMPSHSSMASLNQHSGPPTPGSGFHASGSVSLAAARQALETFSTFIQAEPSGTYEPQVYMTIGKLMNQMNLQQGQIGGDIGFHRVESADFNQYMKQE